MCVYREEPRGADEEGAAGEGRVSRDGAEGRPEHHRRVRRGAGTARGHLHRRVQVQHQNLASLIDLRNQKRKETSTKCYISCIYIIANIANVGNVVCGINYNFLALLYSFD